MDALLGTLSSHRPSDAQKNAAGVLASLARTPTSPLATTLASPEFAERVFEQAFASSLVSVRALDVCIAILEPRTRFSPIQVSRLTSVLADRQTCADNVLPPARMCCKFEIEVSHSLQMIGTLSICQVMTLSCFSLIQGEACEHFSEIACVLWLMWSWQMSLGLTILTPVTGPRFR